MGVFADWQPIYAAYGISTFPVDGEGKRPLIRGYDQVDIAGSAKLVAKFGAADAFGFNVKRAGIVVVDLDTPDAAMLEEALQTHGPSPIIVRSATGNHHVYYRHSGERRHIRPWSGKPVDILGDGYVVAPPSRRPNGSYQFLRGSLDDLPRLSPMRGTPTARSGERRRGEGNSVSPGAGVGQRNDALWRHCMRQARRCDAADDLLTVARTFNNALAVPLEDREAVQAAASAWKITEAGENRFGQHGAYVTQSEVSNLLANGNSDALALLTFLRAHNGPDAKFWVANKLADVHGWSRKRLACARRQLLDLGYLSQIGLAAPKRPALFCWPNSFEQYQRGGWGEGVS